MCIPLSFNTHTHRFTELPPHWLQHDDVTSHMIGCKAAEGRGGDAVREGGVKKERWSERKCRHLCGWRVFVKRSKRRLCVCFSALTPLWRVCEVAWMFWGTAWRRGGGDPNTTPSQKHEASYLPADLWLWVYLGVCMSVARLVSGMFSSKF